jgi:hypothetical protein
LEQIRRDTFRKPRVKRVHETLYARPGAASHQAIFCPAGKQLHSGQALPWFATAAAALAAASASPK